MIFRAHAAALARCGPTGPCSPLRRWHRGNRWARHRRGGSIAASSLLLGGLLALRRPSGVRPMGIVSQS
jgi:hypothetical protein